MAGPIIDWLMVGRTRTAVFLHGTTSRSWSHRGIVHTRETQREKAKR